MLQLGAGAAAMRWALGQPQGNCRADTAELRTKTQNRGSADLGPMMEWAWGQLLA